MTDREKLIELWNEAEEWADHKCDELDCDKCPADKMYTDCVKQLAVERLIANGVTVQQWIPVTEGLPQKDEPYGATCEQVQVLLNDGFVTTGWCNRGMKMWFYLPYGDTHFVGNDYEKSPVIAWQPLAKSPKE